MKILFISLFLLSSFTAAAQSETNTSRAPEDQEEEQAFTEWDEEEEEAQEQAERERWILEERARGYEPTTRRYKPVLPGRRQNPGKGTETVY